MTCRYIAAQRPDGSPSRHLTARQLRRMRQRFRRVLALAISASLNRPIERTTFGVFRM